MKKELFRAKHSYSDRYIISDSIKWELDMLYLLDNGAWKECEPTTRSVSYQNMADKNGKKIFASLSEDGNGGDKIHSYNYLNNLTGKILIFNGVFGFNVTFNSSDGYELKNIEVIGIHNV